MTAVFAKVGVGDIHSDVATFFRTVVVVLVLGVILLATRQFQSPSEWSGKAVLFLILSGLGTGASWVCYFRALKIGNVSQVAPVDKLSVVFVALIAVAFLGERLSALNWTGVLFIVAGVILIGMK